MKRLLLVEDHENLRCSIQDCLQSEGFEVTAVGNVTDASKILADQFDLMILDWMLPDGQGIDLLKQMRSNSSRTPVIFLTARVDTFDKVLALELGASDYITKPFEPRELIARVRVRLREIGFQTDHRDNECGLVKVGSLVIDRIKRKVTFKGQAIELVKKEFDLLLLFAEHPEKVFCRDEILNKVWGYDVYPTTRTVDTHVMLIRQKVGDSLIETVRSVGYKFQPS